MHNIRSGGGAASVIPKKVSVIPLGGKVEQ